jgi:hypothetical protein
MHNVAILDSRLSSFLILGVAKAAKDVARLFTWWASQPALGSGSRVTSWRRYNVCLKNVGILWAEANSPCSKPWFEATQKNGTFFRVFDTNWCRSSTALIPVTIVGKPCYESAARGGQTNIVVPWTGCSIQRSIITSYSRAMSLWYLSSRDVPTLTIVLGGVGEISSAWDLVKEEDMIRLRSLGISVLTLRYILMTLWITRSAPIWRTLDKDGGLFPRTTCFYTRSVTDCFCLKYLLPNTNEIKKKWMEITHVRSWVENRLCLSLRWCKIPMSQGNARREQNVWLVAIADSAAVMSHTVGSVRHLVGLPHTLYCFDKFNGWCPDSSRGVVWHIGRPPADGQ